MYTDLHLHTHFSDGTYTPEFLAAEAKRFGLVAIALTDHDTIEGCDRTQVACEDLGIEFVAATELTAEFKGTEMHLLGYFIDTKHHSLLQEMARFQEVRQNRIREMVARLIALDLPITEEAVFTLANCNSPGRPHIARALIEAKVCRSVDEAFERFLKKNRPAWVPKFKIDAVDAIALIHEAGGLAVLAHPLLIRRDELIPELVEAKLDGLECYHTRHTPSISEHYELLADQYGLLVTGGSDCHGMNKGKPLIGSIKLPYENIRRMKSRLAVSHPSRLVPEPSGTY